METIKAVKCEICGALFEASGKNFLHLAGGLFVGLYGGILGGAVEEGNIHDSVYCIECFRKVVDEHFPPFGSGKLVF